MVRGVHEIIFDMTSERQPCSVLWIGDEFQSFCYFTKNKRTKTFRSIPKVFLKRFSE